ncbi:hypothetical protein GALL_409930 [mine drainage metagenome]|uniref:Uncharacterized protein n=1 Tax=mine drainage metagenome TaxID=410659 RepID=A0A1J5QBI4_9ZZZZ
MAGFRLIARPEEQCKRSYREIVVTAELDAAKVLQRIPPKDCKWARNVALDPGNRNAHTVQKSRLKTLLLGSRILAPQQLPITPSLYLLMQPTTLCLSKERPE